MVTQKLSAARIIPPHSPINHNINLNFNNSNENNGVKNETNVISDPSKNVKTDENVAPDSTQNQLSKLNGNWWNYYTKKCVKKSISIFLHFLYRKKLKINSYYLVEGKVNLYLIDIVTVGHQNFSPPFDNFGQKHMLDKINFEEREWPSKSYRFSCKFYNCKQFVFYGKKLSAKLQIFFQPNMIL